MHIDKTLETVFAKAELEMEITEIMLNHFETYHVQKLNGRSSAKIDAALELQAVMKKSRSEAKKVLAIRDLYGLAFGR